MALTGNIFKLNDNELKLAIESNFSNIEKLNQEADISYFLIDFMEIMSSYSGIEKSVFRKILEGHNSFMPNDGYIGYSFSNEVEETKETVLDKISIDDFDKFLQKGLEDKHTFTSIDNHESIRKYFSTIKNAYENAFLEQKALVFRIG
jgi:hypothetical protein